MNQFNLLENTFYPAQALGLNGQKLLGIPISVQHTQAEKNRIQTQAVAQQQQQPVKNITGPMRLYVGSLHFNITEDMLRGIFEPFGKIDSIQLIMDTETGRSKGYGFITVSNSFEEILKILTIIVRFEILTQYYFHFNFSSIMLMMRRRLWNS